MSTKKHDKVPRPSTQALQYDSRVSFLAGLMQVTGTPDKQEDFQAKLQTYCESLRPWLEPSDGPPNPRAMFSLLESCECDESGEYISVVLSPEAEALFRAWLRRNKIFHDGGFHIAHAWSN